jgi:uncharacterized membrane protein (DUF2068 family)
MSLRPSGVTGIAIIFLIGAALFIVLGAICLAAPLTVIDVLNGVGDMVESIPLIGGIAISLLATLAANLLYVGIVGIIIGVIDILIFIGLLKLKKWGYWLAIIISIPLIVVILGIIFIWYLRKDEVKAAFDIR